MAVSRTTEYFNLIERKYFCFFLSTNPREVQLLIFALPAALQTIRCGMRQGDKRVNETMSRDLLVCVSHQPVEPKIYTYSYVNLGPVGVFYLVKIIHAFISVSILPEKSVVQDEVV